jgi:hypothetical protein
MIFAALLGARKKVPVWRVGRAQTWMRGHLWLGLLSLPLIVLHSGFRYGHGLTAVLMTLLIIVVASGVFGAALQHYMPRVMTREITMETIYEEIGHVRAQLLEEAEGLVKQATTVTIKAAAPGAKDSTEDSAVAVVEDQSSPLRNFFAQELYPFLKNPGARGHALGNEAQSRNAFIQLRTLVSPALHSRRSRKYLRRGAATHAAIAVAFVAARLAAAARSAFACVDFARRRACGDGAAILKIPGCAGPFNMTAV